MPAVVRLAFLACTKRACFREAIPQVGSRFVRDLLGNPSSEPGSFLPPCTRRYSHADAGATIFVIIITLVRAVREADSVAETLYRRTAQRGSPVWKLGLDASTLPPAARIAKARPCLAVETVFW